VGHPAAVTAGVTLTAEGVTRRFGSREAVTDVSFALRPAEIVALIGPNGAGKTTLLSMLAGVLAPSEGTVRVGGDGSGGGDGVGRVGWVPQEPALYRKLSVAENLRLFARLERVSSVPAAVERMLEQTGLADRANEPVGLLSGGNQQRLNIAIGLLREPAVLLLDEPSASLDPRQRERLWEFIGRLRQDGTTVLYSTHDVGEAARHAARVIVLADGALLFDGPPAGLGTGDFERVFVEFLARHGH
jgi:ABC-2 type transport system ATP-binding protein